MVNGVNIAQALGVLDVPHPGILGHPQDHRMRQWGHLPGDS